MEPKLAFWITCFAYMAVHEMEILQNIPRMCEQYIPGSFFHGKIAWELKMSIIDQILRLSISYHVLQ